MTFSSLPAATLKKRITLDPSVSLTFAEGLDAATVLYTDGQYLTVTADEAGFESTITFSGYLKYNFWGFKLEKLYFDIDASFEAEVQLSADVVAKFEQSFKYEPEDLSYSLVNVPGIISLGPGIAFGIGVDIAASAAVGLTTGLTISLPDGNVHVDLVDGTKTAATGWTPEYKTFANISEAAEVQLNAGAAVTVELAIKLLGGLVDLSSGLTASPGFENLFTLQGEQHASANGTITPTNVTASTDTSKDICGDSSLRIKSDFVFDLTAFVTQWWKQSLYSTTVPLWDKTYEC
jgi:hypothetical protein